MPNPQEILDNYKKRINRSLQSFFNKEKRESIKKLPFYKFFSGTLKEYNLRKWNKRIRGILVILGYELLNGRKTDEILKIACSSELIHSSFLIHDDIIDRDIFRRGSASLHYFFEKLHQKKFKKGESKHYGLSMGIMAGDIGYAQSYLSILNSKFPEHLKNLASIRFHQMYFDTCYGQILDVINSYKEKVSEKEVLEVYKYKTAKYTLETPLHLGAIFAGATKKQLEIISKFAIPLGITFQIHDDILGMFGNKKTIGKPVTSDLEEGKQTLLMVNALHKANHKQRKLLLKYFGHKNIKIADLNKVRQIITETEALKYCQNYAKVLVSNAKKTLKQIKKVNKNTLFLLNYLADYIIKRDY